MPVLPNNARYFSVDEMPYGRSGEWNLDGSRDHTRVFKVVVRSKTMTDIDAMSAPLLPRLGAPWTSPTGDLVDMLARLVKYSATQESDDDWQNWTVTAHYSTNLPVPTGLGVPTPGTLNAPQGGKGGSANNPEEEPIEIELDWETEKLAMPHDLDGKPYWNTARQPFNPPPLTEVHHPVLVLTRNELFWSMKTATQFAGSVNSKNFLGNKPGQVKCFPPKVKLANRGGLLYWRVTYRLAFFNVYDDLNIPDSEKTWQLRLLNQGLCERKLVKIPLVGGGFVEKKMPIPIFRHGHPISQPVCLGEDGLELRFDDEDDLERAAVKPHYIQFRNHKTYDFNKLLERGLEAVLK